MVSDVVSLSVLMYNEVCYALNARQVLRRTFTSFFAREHVGSCGFSCRQLATLVIWAPKADGKGGTSTFV